MIVSDWNAHQKNTLRGFLSFTTASGMVVHGCTLHQKNDSRCIGLPSRQYTKDDGSITYSPLIEFATKESRQCFQASALEAVDRFVGTSCE